MMFSVIMRPAVLTITIGSSDEKFCALGSRKWYVRATIGLGQSPGSNARALTTMLLLNTSAEL